MNAFFKNAGTVLGTIWVWSLLLVLCSAVFVWFFGPLLAVDDHRFWQDSTARLVTISALFLLWGLAMVLTGGRGAAGLKKPEKQAHHQQLGWVEDEQKHVRGRFKEAVHRLKTSSRYAGHNERWRNDLPWYLLIGEQGSGKTHLLAAAGLQLPFDRVEAPPTQGTAYCEWYFANEGVLIDTPGRYLTQLDSSVDAAGWSTLLSLLRLRRRARPLNGVVVTLSVDTLLTGNDHDLNYHARHVHSRLQEIQQILHVDVPVYLLLTQADRVPGFTEFFDSSPGEDAASVLGQRLDAGTAGIDIAQVRQAFETLLQRLSSELITRLHQERNVERRGHMLDFPQQAAHLGERLCLFVESAFSAHRYQRINGLRGFYLTSAGDRRNHFIQGLFSRVIFAEADLAGLQTQEQHRIRRRQGLLVMAAAVVIGGAGWLWTHSYSVNQQRLLQLAALTAQPSPTVQGAEDMLVVLALLDARLAATQVFPFAHNARFVERAGLYQGEVSRPLLTRAYEQALHQQLLARITAQLEEQVRASLGDRERLLESLRAYLMLSLRERRDAGWLAQRVADHWSVRYAGDTSAQKRLNEHLARLLEQPFAASLNEELVAQARKELRGESLADVVYRVLREQSRNLEPLRLVEGKVFAAIDPPIPGFYTKRYLQYFEAQGPRLVNAIAQDNWVLGEGTDLSAVDLRRLMIELQQRYFTEYADAWSAALGRVSLQQTDSLRHDAERLAGLTSAQSPLMQLLLLLRENTRLLPTHELLGNVAHQTGELGVLAQSVVADGQVAVLPDSARRALQRRFEPLHQLLDEQQNPGVELTQALRLLDELHLQLAALNRESSPEQAAFQRVKRRMEGQQDVLGNLRDAAARLPLPLAGWFEGMADDSWRHLLEGAYAHVNQRYQSEVHGLYAKAIRQRYPFNAHATSDVALNDFQEFFKPQGVMARFYEGYLRPFISADGGRYRLRGLDGSSLPISRSLLDQLMKAQVIRHSFFTEEQGELSVRFTLAPYSLDQSVSRATLRFGEKQLEYRHGTIVPMVFHWPTDADNGRSSLVLERGTEQRPLGIEKNTGAWSLFRFFDLLQREPASGRNTQIFKADLAGLRANYLLTSQRTPSPFEMEVWRTFRLPEQL
ncbi:type VI secretion system membrane subunit TssM [Pseudomonas costantinii]|uniref:Type VI secretion protein VasK n=1 Tax=Pseudomonas costantinii TaxID=168469 RepID=A0A1S2V3K9_9PSED|nr:type VI secretion system membrane subunit TssM [Pseudomonas costantinii]OIN53334.1 type VI secretion protein VasK [Pseudomonas costantinii]SEE51685.1 type VI secretion system protein ImpL [Pseudomonas costantinii]